MKNFRGQKLGDILLAMGVVSLHELRAALEHAAQWEQPLGRSLVALGLCTEQTVVRARAMKFGLPSVRLDRVLPDRDILDLVGVDLAQRFQVLPLAVLGTSPRSTLQLAMSNPEAMQAVTEIEFKTGMKVSIVLAGDADLGAAIQRCYGDGLDYLPMVQDYLPSLEEVLDVDDDVFAEPTLEPDPGETRVHATNPSAPEIFHDPSKKRG